MSVDMGHSEAVAKVLAKLHVSVNYRERGTPYTDDAVRFCEIFVIILPDRRWKMPVNQLPAGTRKELKMAADRGIPIYTGYYGVINGEWGIYRTIYKEGHSEISGMSGTSGSLQKYLESDNFVFTKKPPYNLEDNHSSKLLKEEDPEDLTASYLESKASKRSGVYGSKGQYSPADLSTITNRFSMSVDPGIKDASDMARLSMSLRQSDLRVSADYITNHGIGLYCRPDPGSIQKLQGRTYELESEFDERLLLFYKPSK
jgi:hypothetical protein